MPSANVASLHVVVIGGGPAGLMAAEGARAAGAEVALYDRMGSVGRKFLIAGKGGLNLTHSDPFDTFVTRYGSRAGEIKGWLREFDAGALRDWARGLGVETFVGSSGRVFPLDLKAAPLLRSWVRRLRACGVRFHMHHEWLGWDKCDALLFAHGGSESAVPSDAVVLALGVAAGRSSVRMDDGRLSSRTAVSISLHSYRRIAASTSTGAGTLRHAMPVIRSNPSSLNGARRTAGRSGDRASS